MAQQKWLDSRNFRFPLVACALLAQPITQLISPQIAHAHSATLASKSFNCSATLPASARITLLRRGCEPVTWFGRINAPADSVVSAASASPPMLSPAIPAVVFSRSGTLGNLQQIEAHKTYTGQNATAPTSEQISYACSAAITPVGPGAAEAPPEAFQATLKLVNPNAELIAPDVPVSYQLHCREDQSEEGTRRVQHWNELERFRASEHTDRELGYIGIGDEQFDMSSFTEQSENESAQRARQALAVGTGIAAGAAAHHALNGQTRRLPRLGPIWQMLRRAPLEGSLR